MAIGIKNDIKKIVPTVSQFIKPKIARTIKVKTINSPHPHPCFFILKD